MATSKNNRKKGRKRSASHAAPPGYVGKKQEQITQQEEANYRASRRDSLIKWTGLFIMLIGFWLAYETQYSIGYVITIIGALIGFFTVRKGARYARLSMACYGIYIAMIVFIWVSGGVS
ncbi:MAG: hypothetical protein Q4F79_04780 [Eubacteriales bacterium]|nr:hypothetical protein [Eubacteriales bacterium]